MGLHLHKFDSDPVSDRNVRLRPGHEASSRVHGYEDEYHFVIDQWARG